MIHYNSMVIVREIAHIVLVPIACSYKLAGTKCHPLHWQQLLYP